MDKLTNYDWDQMYKKGQVGWDIGYVSTPLKEYFDQLINKSIKILIPGAGNAYEAEYLYKNGFINVFILDYSSESIKSFKKRYPEFPSTHLIQEDFFEHQDQYDLIVEQTFFSSILPRQRNAYTQKIYELLKPNGKFVGLLFTHEFDFQGPPFGGSENLYREIFSPLLDIITMEIARNSIKPRKERELFFIMQKKSS